MKIGDILECSWGYDQTNVDFYKVLKVSNGWATVQAIGTDETYDNSYGFMTGVARPDYNKTGKTFRRKIQNWGNGDSISINTYSSANIWDGKPARTSHYA